MSVLEIETVRESAGATPPQRSGAPSIREIRHEYTPSLPPILNQLGISLLVSTYQAGKVVAVGVAQGELTLSSDDAKHRGIDRAHPRQSGECLSSSLLSEPGLQVSPARSQISSSRRGWRCGRGQRR